jgi:diguanylate cyclase (GGDEF)-like protein
MSIDPAPAAADESTPSLQQEELRGTTRAVTGVHWLLLILVLLFAIFGTLDPLAEAAILAALCFYAALVMAFASFYRSGSRWKMAIETSAMIAFITWVLWFTGGLASPLLSTYMLPVIISALALGRAATLIEVALIAACQVFLGLGNLLSLAFLSGFAAQTVPLLLVAYVVTMSSSGIRHGLSRKQLLSETDELTGLLNMRGFSITANRLFGLALRCNRAATVLMVDLDNFKALNDSHGHEVGNRMLRQLARLILAELRFTDVLARYGGDEFIVLLPETPSEGALEVVGRIRNSVANAPLWVDGKRITCTVSIGVAEHPADGNTMDAVVARASHAMSQAKQQGGNRAARSETPPG